MTDTIKFDLLSNASDSISYAIEVLAWPDIQKDERRMKQAVLSVAQGIELLLKERLRRIHPAFIFEDVDKFPSLDARTVGADRAMSRLAAFGGLNFSQADRTLVRDLRRTRNAIEHSEWHISLRGAKGIIGPALSFALDFAHVEFGRDLAYEFRRDDTWDQLLSELREFASAHALRLTAKTALHPSRLLTCESCNQDTLDRLECSCPLCGYWNTDQEFGW